MQNIQTFIDVFFKQGGYLRFFTGLQNTLIIAVFGLVIGFVLGCIVATVKIIPNKTIISFALNKLCEIYVVLFRGTPIVVQLLLMHFALFPALGILVDNVVEGAVIFGLNSGAYMSEIIRSGIQSVDKGQMEAGRSLGFGYWQSIVLIVLPQAIKNVLPTIGNEFIALIKETSVLNFIAVLDITQSLKAIADSTYEYFIPYIVLALVYLTLVLIITMMIKKMERRFAKNERA